MKYPFLRIECLEPLYRGKPPYTIRSRTRTWNLLINMTLRFRDDILTTLLAQCRRLPMMPFVFQYKCSFTAVSYCQAFGHSIDACHFECLFQTDGEL